MSLDDYLRVKHTPHEFFRYCKIYDANTKKIIDFIFWDHLVEFIRILKNEQYIIVLKSKQLGFSYTVSLDTLRHVLTEKAYTASFISAGERESAQLLEKPKVSFQHLPDWLKLPPDKWTESEIRFPDMANSKIIALPSTPVPGLGMTVSRVVMDEWDFHPYAESTFATAEAAASAGGQIIGQSTANTLVPIGSLFKETFRQALKGQNKFFPVFYGWKSRPDRDSIWYEDRRKFYIGREDDLKKNYPNTIEEALSPVSAQAFFDAKVIEEMLENTREPPYSKFQPATVYGIGADVSQGVGQDFQAAVLLAKRGVSVEDVAYIHGNDFMPETFAFLSYELAKQFNFPLLAGENNSIGIAYLNALLDMHYPKLYYQDEKQTRLGWNTGAMSREKMLHDLAQAIANRTINIRHKPTLLQLLEFQKMESRGTIKIQSIGKHDDLVIALAIAYQMIKGGHAGGKYKSLLVKRRTGGMYG